MSGEFLRFDKIEVESQQEKTAIRGLFSFAAKNALSATLKSTCCQESRMVSMISKTCRA
jgi:hypothetical protein